MLGQLMAHRERCERYCGSKNKEVSQEKTLTFLLSEDVNATTD